jgi:hypothetical protein
MGLGYSLFLAPLLLNLKREMGQIGVPGQLLLRFAPFLLQWYSYYNVDDSYKNDTNQVSGWWNMREWWWKLGCTPRKIRHWSPSWLQSSSSAISRAKLPLGPELDCSQLGDQYSIHLSKTPPFGASDDHLWVAWCFDGRLDLLKQICLTWSAQLGGHYHTESKFFVELNMYSWLWCCLECKVYCETASSVSLHHWESFGKFNCWKSR